MSDRKTELRNFLDAMVDSNTDQAQVHFHNYLEDRMKSIINAPRIDTEEEVGSDKESPDDK